ncbi:hypothetical protein [Streptomyces sp. NPDC006971]|uniref:hypothetical protein n=1 Tax=Streptomyces sp. NPDC006971 TaxID=3154784 RepID=UPI0033E62B9C
MTCGNCGAAAAQGPDGSWTCSNQCGWSSAAPAVAIIPEITTTRCRGCDAQVYGLDGRYACGLCSWSNHWDEGHRPLPTADRTAEKDVNVLE